MSIFSAAEISVGMKFEIDLLPKKTEGPEREFECPVCFIGIGVWNLKRDSGWCSDCGSSFAITTDFDKPSLVSSNGNIVATCMG